MEPLPADLDELPDVYASKVAGRCMEPELCDGDLVIFDKLAPCRRGDLVVCYLRREVLGPSWTKGNVKRLALDLPQGLTFPFDPHPESEVEPLLILEQLNPHRYFKVRCSQVAALYRCLGKARAEGEFAVLDPEVIDAARNEMREHPSGDAIRP